VLYLLAAVVKGALNLRRAEVPARELPVTAAAHAIAD